ncbi:MAG: heavy-metal-associated domain-containing protein [Campylobacterales bacterium]|jgi:copper chaperone|uniref:Heavy metal transport/detoxification protein n=1 Tax=Sulfurospirillum deleyianum (strain ATCC 51133 / DSM 6946 / 5175) TaxID=525898 RepID=D1B1Y9_SULD5|nr:heavy-metal-associated domain-containing protein [Sulfurospirillum deleyianum]MBN1838742.1 heavy-metal-associated domain-containing protein [Campylobacterales bacterium]MBP9566613.1 heavy-metal-associated domain-containing protein [Sulfurospirillum sp.]ACZ12109.1 heavy metal transport/detoxification protein [Sulfurospirillum deleyianum DSM 6946]MBN2832059.1 heavy-metal-associated domain-containing protein [Campylobacterales bacterium]MCD8478595.1 heavy-metal-associated domain-containing pro
MKKSYEVLNIKCGGCAGTVKSKLKERFPDIEVSLESEPRVVSATIESDEDERYLLETLKSLGYPSIHEDLGSLEGALLKGKSFVSCAIGKMSQDKGE